MPYREPHVSPPLLPFSFRDYVQALLVEQASAASMHAIRPIGNGAAAAVWLTNAARTGRFGVTVCDQVVMSPSSAVSPQLGVLSALA